MVFVRTMMLEEIFVVGIFVIAYQVFPVCREMEAAAIDQFVVKLFQFLLAHKPTEFR